MLPAKATRSQRRCDGHQGLHAQVVLRIGLSDATSDIKDIARTLIPLNFVRPVTPKFCEVLSYPAAMLEMGEAQATARTFGLEGVRGEIRRAEDIAPAFEALKGGADAIYVCPDALVTT